MAIALFAWEWHHQSALEIIRKETERSKQASEREMIRAAQENQAYENSLIRAREMVGRWSELGQSLGEAPGMSNVSRETLENAVAYYEEFLSRSGKSPEVRIQAARASIRVSVLYGQLGLWRQAENGLRNAESFLLGLPMEPEVDWELSDCRMHRGMLFERLERWDESEDAYNLSIERLQNLVIRFRNEPKYGMRLANTWIRLSLVLQQQKMIEKSLAILTLAIEQQVECFALLSGSKDSVNAVWLNHTKTEGDLVEKLLDQCSALEKRIGPLDSNAWKVLCDDNCAEELAMGLDTLGFTLQSLGRYPPAERAYRSALEFRKITEHHRPGDIWRHQFVARNQRHLGLLLFERQRKSDSLEFFNDAIDRMERLARDYPDRIDYRIDLSQTLCEAARIIRANSEPLRAIATVQRAIRIQEDLIRDNPQLSIIKKDLALSFSTMALSHHSFEEYPEAFEYYEKSLKTDPTLVTAMNNYSWLLSTVPILKFRDPVRARQLALEAVKRNPNSGFIRSTLAMAHYRNGEFNEADQLLSKLLEENSGNSIDNWLLKAMIEAKLGRTESAERWLKNALERPVDSPTHGKILKKLGLEVEEVIRECKNLDDSDGLLDGASSPSI